MLPALRVVIGGTQIVVSLHGLAIVLGVGAGAVLAVRRARKPAPVLVAAAAVAAVSLVGGHMLFALLHGGRGVLWTGGLASTGGIAAGLGAAFVVARVTRRPAGELLDALVPAGLAAAPAGRGAPPRARRRMLAPSGAFHICLPSEEPCAWPMRRR